jgi:peptidoglycan/xylan/chitin deacetylase (PgdA/CDA1 family)
LPREAAVTVLGWHRVDDVDDELAITPATFASQMAVLDRQRDTFPVLPLDRAMAGLADGTAPRRSVVVTFDDAWADNHTHALGPLVEHAIPALLYVPSRKLGDPGYMTVTQLREMVAAGVEVGAHSRTHPDLRACTDAELESEVRGGREDLEDLLGRSVPDFAYPTGYLDDRVVAAVVAAGFRSAVTTRRGFARAGVDRLQVPRSFVEEFDPPTFQAASRGGLNLVGAIDAVKARLTAR